MGKINAEIKPTPLPFSEAQAFWKDKVKLSPGEFRQLSDEAKVRAFAVSGVAKGDELETIFNSIQRAIDGGATFADFKKDCAAIAAKRGWSKYRLDNIFRTNVQTSYMVGRFRQVQLSAKFRPYGKYSGINDSRTRPTHLAMHGRIYPLDHPFWDIWWPPNGFRCRCDVVTLSERQVKDRGLTVETDDITGGLIEPIDPKTGRKMPARPLMPDNGFSHNPAKSYYGGLVDSADLAGLAKAGKLADQAGSAGLAKDGRSADQAGSAGLAKDGRSADQAGLAGLANPSVMASLKGPADYRRPKLANVAIGQVADLDTSQLLPSGKEDAFYVDQFKKKYGTEKVVADAMGEPVIISLRSFMANKTPGAETYKFKKSGHAESINLLSDMVEHPYEIWLTPQQDKTGKIRLTKRYISLWKTEDKKRIGGFAVFETYKGVLQGVTSFIPLKKNGQPNLNYTEKQRAGILLFPKKKKGQ